MHLLTKKLIMRHYVEQRNEDCLYWYFQTLRDLGERAPYVKKADIYAVVAARVYVSVDYCRKIICEMMRDEGAVARAAERVV